MFRVTQPPGFTIVTEQSMFGSYMALWVMVETESIAYTFTMVGPGQLDLKTKVSPATT